MHVENSDETTSTRYFHKDHLGSISIITDEAGAVVERLSYDAWGKRRNADGTDDPAGSITSQTTRGFTGHEELDWVGLVHMNGRVYDPLLARFGTADPMTESPFSMQGWNRYSYVGNSPLTSPTLAAIASWAASGSLRLQSLPRRPHPRGQSCRSRLAPSAAAVCHPGLRVRRRRHQRLPQGCPQGWVHHPPFGRRAALRAGFITRRLVVRPETVNKGGPGRLAQTRHRRPQSLTGTKSDLIQV